MLPTQFAATPQVLPLSPSQIFWRGRKGAAHSSDWPEPAEDGHRTTQLGIVHPDQRPWQRELEAPPGDPRAV